MSSEERQRLSTFAHWPIPSDDCSPISNFVFKAAGAFFQRTADCVKDTVVCQSCAVRFSGWNTVSPTSDFALFRSPAAVHRVIGPKCPALNPSIGDTVTMELDWNLLMQSPFARYLPNHIQTNRATPECSPHPACDERRARARRVLFPESHQNQQQSDDDHEQESAVETSQNQNASASDLVPRPSVLDQNGMTHPFKPKSGNYDHLFASHRLQTFPQPITCTKYQTWAEEGFIFYRENQCVMCVYCGTELALNGHQPGVVHQEKCPSCPFVMGFDVGNITQEQERWIRRVYFQQQAAERQRERDSFEIMAVKYVQYQEEEDRLGTFQGWPRMYARIFPPDIMAFAGFFYSGYSDKVTCFCCGVTLYDWREEADVWITHATVSPSCQHVSSVKGQDFIAQAANLQIQAEVMYPKDSCSGEVSNSSSDGVGKEVVGSSSLDMAAVRAALACRYPNEAILKASLKATDENHITICRQQQVVRQKDTCIQQQGQQLQQKDTQLQQKDTQLQQQGEQWQQQLQQKDTQLQQKDTQLHAVRQEKEQTVQTLQHQLDDTVTRMNEQLDVKEQQLDEKEQQLQLQEQQIQRLMQQVQQLRADHHHRADLAPGPQGDGHAANGRVDVSAEVHQSSVCKICMTDKPRMIFLPCGHLFCCAQCTSRLPNKRCPVCRQDISQVLPAFVA